MKAHTASLAPCSLPQQPSRAGEMDTAADQPFSEQQAHAGWQELLQAMKRRRRDAREQVGHAHASGQRSSHDGTD